MLFDRCWHSSAPLDKVCVGDVLRVMNKDTGAETDWRVTEAPVTLSKDEARAEWLKYPFGGARFAERHGFFPHVVRGLTMIEERPPKKPSPRHIPSEVRIRVYNRDQGKCKRCGSRENLEFDHIVPVSRGGSNTEKNIELLCRSCNRRKLDKIE